MEPIGTSNSLINLENVDTVRFPLDTDDPENKFAGQSEFKTPDESAMNVLKFGAPAVLAGMANTFSDSLGITDEREFSAALQDVFPQFGMFFKENQRGAQVAGDLVGMFIPGMLAAKAIRGGGFIANAVSPKNRLLASVFTSGKRFDEITSKVNARAKFLATRGKQLDITKDKKFRELVHQARKEKIGDSVKESVAFELGVLATMNQSDALYPDEFTFVENFALAAAPAGVFIAAEALYLNRVIRNGLNELRGVAAHGLNPENLPLGDKSNIPGVRDIDATVTSLAIKANNRELAAISTEASANVSVNEGVELAQSAFNAANQQMTRDLNELIGLMGKDKPFRFAHATELSTAEKSTVTNILTAQNGNPIAVMGTSSLEHFPGTEQGIKSFINSRQKSIDTISEELKKLFKQRDELRVGDPDKFEAGAGKLQSEIDKLNAELNAHNATNLVVFEPDGTVTNLLDRKIRFHDTQGSIQTRNRTQIEPKQFVVNFADTMRANKKLLAVDENLNISMPAIKEAIHSGVNVTKILPVNQRFVAGEDFSLVLKDMGEDWHFKTGKRGREVFNTFTDEIQDEIKAWTGSSSASNIRKWVDENDPRAQVIYQAYEGMRIRLRELADPDGTITLFRGESKSETAALNKNAEGTNDIVSMSSNPDTSKGFASGAGNLISRRVHVDDVIMIVGGKGDEFEFIVRGNRNRNAGEIITPQSFEALNFEEKTGVWSAAQKAVESFTPGHAKVFLTPNDHFVKKDAVLQLVENNGTGILEHVDLGKFDSLDAVEFSSLNDKLIDFVRMRKVEDAAADSKSGIKIADSARMTPQQISEIYNIPSVYPGFQGLPVAEAFENLYQQGHKNLYDAVNTLDEFRQLVRRTERPYDNIELVDAPVQLRGTMLQFNSDLKPVIGINRQLNPTDFTRDALIRKTAALQEERLAALRTSDQDGAILVKHITDQLDGQPSTAAVKRPENLQEGSQRGTGLLRPQSEVFRENETLRASDDMANNIDRTSEDLIAQQFFDPHVSNFNRIRSSANKGSLESLNIAIHSNRQGWELKPDIVNLGDGKFAWAVVDNKHNREIWQRQGYDINKFNPDFEEVLMPASGRSASGEVIPTPVVVDEMALEVFNSITTLSRQSGVESNAIKKSLSLPPTRLRPWHIPPRNFAAKEILYLRSNSGEIIGMVSGKTIREANNFADQAVKVERQAGRDVHKLTSDDIANYLEAQDLAFQQGLRDYSDTFRQQGKASGRSSSPIVEIGPGPLSEVIESLQRSFQSTIRRTRAAYFEPQINYAKQLHGTAAPEKSRRGQDVYQRYLANIYGNTQVNPNDRLTTVYSSIEGMYDDVLHAKILPLIHGATAVPARDRARFEALNKKLPGHNPFRDVQDFMERTHNVRTPQNMRKHMGALNSFTTFLTLGLFEAGHALLNLTSLAATAPAVIKALRRMPAETADQYGARIGAYGTVMSNDTAMFSPIRAITTAIHDFWQPQFRQQIQRAADLGYFKQEIAEMVATITAPRQGYATSIGRKAADMASILTRKSEELSRLLSFTNGLSIAQRGLGIVDETAQFAFAHRFANDVIGDYRPSNRPRIFQGAVGMPLGLFSTFFLNYFNRVFNYIENRQLRALATQMATQAGVFGGQTVPGFDQFVNMFASNYDGTVNPVDALRDMVGDDKADWMLYGALSNLPKMIPGVQDGIGLTTRGDANFVRIPTLFTIDQAPSFQMLSNMFNLTRKTFEMVRMEGGFNNQQMLEIMGNYSQNRALRNLSYWFAGYSVDRRGQIISDDVRSGISTAARVLGMRPIQELKKIEALQRTRQTTIAQRSRMLQLRDNINARIRGGDLGDVNEIFVDYIRFGGTPTGFAKWIKNQFLRSHVDAPTRQLLEHLKIPARSADVQRLMSVLDLPENDPMLE